MNTNWRNFGLSTLLHVALILSLFALLKTASFSPNPVDISISPIEKTVIKQEVSAPKPAQFISKPSENRTALTEKTTNFQVEEGQNQYQALLHDRILAKQHYPVFARKHHLEGLIQVKLKLSSDGMILQKSVFSAGKSPVLEAAALEAVEAASPFPPLPRGNSGDFLVPVEFHLE